MSSLYTVLFLIVLTSIVNSQLLTVTTKDKSSKSVAGVNIQCDSSSILVKIRTSNMFNGMIYPKGLSKNSSCKVEFTNSGQDEVAYRLPLTACNTMKTNVNDGEEYFNTVVIQPHRKLVTSHGRGYHVRCKYLTRDKTVTSGYNVHGEAGGLESKNGESALGTTALTATAPMPGCFMKILDIAGQVAENVKIGDTLTLLINIELQDIYGMKVTDCLVRDGSNLGEQGLMNSEGCPVEPEIMGSLEYSKNKTQAMVNFQAHKFPYSLSVYYQCNIKLCLKETGGCDDVPPLCDASGRNILGKRRKRSSGFEEEDDIVAVYKRESGLFVGDTDAEPQTGGVRSGPEEISDEDELCVSKKWFAIGMALTSLLLIISVLLCVCCIISKRRRKDDVNAPSSIYSGPYTNQAYSKS